MTLLATSYEGALLLLQIPFSALCALVAVILAFPKKTRRISIGFAIAGISITIATAGLELLGYGLHSFTGFREESGVFFSAVFAPLVVCIIVLLFGYSAAIFTKAKRPNQPSQPIPLPRDS
jgi:hypothetical protein